MSGILRLTWRYLTFYRMRTVILLVCLTLTFLLPLYLHFLIAGYDRALTSRAEVTPLLLGAKGNQYELVLRSLYFTRSDRGETDLSLADQQAAESEGRGLVIPLHLGYTAQKFPLVGTSVEYFEFRKLVPVSGGLPAILGDAVLGAEVAGQLGVGPGDSILTDQTSLYNIAAEQPLKLKIVGVLGETHGPDDRAVFVDVKTAWVVAGIGHGHDDLEKPENRGKLLGEEEDGALIGSAAVAQYREITPENLDTFHFHGDPSALPLSSLIVVPESAKSGTLLKGHYGLSKTLQLVPPTAVVHDLLSLVFKVKRFFDASFGLVVVMSALFLVLVVMLTMKLRTRERATLMRIGCARATMFWIQSVELLVLILVSGAIAIVLAWGLGRVFPLGTMI